MQVRQLEVEREVKMEVEMEVEMEVQAVGSAGIESVESEAIMGSVMGGRMMVIGGSGSVMWDWR